MRDIQLTNANNIELETPLQELLLDLGGDAVETDVALGEDALRRLQRLLRCSDVGHGGGVGEGACVRAVWKLWIICLSQRSRPLELASGAG